MENLITEKSEGYELLDSGEGEKLERYGSVLLSRPDTQALWPKKLSKEEWDKSDATFSHREKSGKWTILNPVPEDWNMKLQGLTFTLELLPSKHLGVFPEQSAHWKWLEEKIASSISPERKISVLNLFGYTGGASLACAKAGAEVVHVDASEFAVSKLKKNMELSGLSDKPIRLIVDDARKFVEREIKRGNKYDVIILDPPVYGKGIKGEVWKIEEDLMPLLGRVKNILSVEPIAILLNGYASVYSVTAYKNLLQTITPDALGTLSCGELLLKETSGERLLSSGIFARWEK